MENDMNHMGVCQETIRELGFMGVAYPVTNNILAYLKYCRHYQIKYVVD